MSRSSRKRVAAEPSRCSVHARNEPPSVTSIIQPSAYDASRKTWIVEHLNVSESFLRKQVNGGSGSVEADGGVVSVVTPTSREHYRVVDRDN
jgi:hypothetical protein